MPTEKKVLLVSVLLRRCFVAASRVALDLMNGSAGYSPFSAAAMPLLARNSRVNPSQPMMWNTRE